MSKQITIKSQNYDLAKPTEMTALAGVLKKYIVENKLYTNIKGKNYVHADGWQFAGGMIGLFPRIVSVEELSKDKEIRWRCYVEIVNLKTDTVVGSGFAVCSNKEYNKRAFDDYAVLSMAQTRAIGKAFRNMLGWVIKLAGYETTPAEDIDEKHLEKVESEFEQYNSMIDNAKNIDSLKALTDTIKTSKLSVTEKKKLYAKIKTQKEKFESEAKK